MPSSRLLLASSAAAMAAAGAAILLTRDGAPPATSLLHVSFDPTRELFADINISFAPRWRHENGEPTEEPEQPLIDIRQSHGGSGKQARAVIDGLKADIVSLALAHDIDMIAQAGNRISRDWRARFPFESSPMTSTIVFIVRQGNPKGVHDWSDLARPGVRLVFPNPKTSGGARWSYLAAWGFATDQVAGDADEKDRHAAAFVGELLANVVMFDTGARSAANSFAQRRVGDALVSWESDAILLLAEFPTQGFEVVYPSVSIVAEPCIAVVDRVADEHGTAAAARAYIEYLYTDEGQRIIASHGFRPRSEAIAAEHAAKFPAIRQFTLAERFGDWAAAHERHFASGGTLDAAMAARAENER